MVVSGVTWLLELFDMASPFCRAEVLKTDDAVLTCELAEPTALRVSPVNDSLSSGVGRCGASDAEPSRRGLEAAGSLGLVVGVRRPFWSAGCDDDDGESVALILAFSRSVARSLAALGAAGKNWAKLAPDGGGIAIISYFTSSSVLRSSYLVSEMLADTMHVCRCGC